MFEAPMRVQQPKGWAVVSCASLGAQCVAVILDFCHCGLLVGQHHLGLIGAHKLASVPCPSIGHVVG